MVEPAGAAENGRLFCAILYSKLSSSQDRLGSNIGKVGKEWCFLQALTEGALNFGLDTLNLYAGWLGTGQETRLRFPTVCITKRDRFAKTGSGQTPGNVGNGRRRLVYVPGSRE
jgi:hypothetical protein